MLWLSLLSTGNGMNIPHESYELENGLTILVHEDHSDPIVYLGVTYHVAVSYTHLTLPTKRIV